MKQKSWLKCFSLPAVLIASTLPFQSAYAAKPSHLEHPHSAGTFMIEAMAMRMNMEGLRAGTSDVSNSNAQTIGGKYNNAMVPTEMTMDMFMLMPMYNFTKNTSVMLMFNYLDNNMGMTSVDWDGNGQPCASDMSTSGFGDTQVSLSQKFMDDLFAASIELNIPTGSTDETVDMKMLMGTPAMCHDHKGMVAPYGMQLGSGTYDVTPSLTYLGAYYELRYGAQISYKHRPGENDSGYSLGDEAKAKLWIRKPFSIATLSGTLDIKRWGDIEGSNPELDEMLNMMAPTISEVGGANPTKMKLSPTLYPENYGGTLAEITIGASIPVAMTAIGLDLTFPVYQNLNGLQMKRSWTTALSVSAMF